jgi:aspartyl-tRNA(Asn)/glutamyl-tRNA(Gln) amidotransferase subunit A
MRLDTTGRELNAVVCLLNDDALEDARASDARRRAGAPLGPLDGIPVGIKDIIDVVGVPTTAGSGFPVDGQPGEPPCTPTKDASVVARLRSAGMIPAAKLHTHEWALGVTSVNPHVGPCRNPTDRDRIPGGSSGGSAAAVAARLVPAALGSDTGGSVRIPAALCGVCGLKPTHGRVSLDGVVPLSRTLDHVGPLARSCRDLSMLMNVLVDGAQSEPGASEHGGIDRLRIGVPRHDLWDALAPEVRSAAHAVLEALASAGAEVRDVGGVNWSEIRRVAGTVLLSEAAALHARRLASQPRLFGSDVRRRLETGASIDEQEVADARRQLEWWRQHAADALEGVDVLVMPTTRRTAIRIDEADGVTAAADYTRFTAPFNLLGLPALSMPAPVPPGAIPVGIQLVAGNGQDTALLELGAALEALLVRHVDRTGPDSHPGP